VSFLDYMLENLTEADQTKILNHIHTRRTHLTTQPRCTCDPCCDECGHDTHCPANTTPGDQP
jgi:hypothetical protein